MVIAAVSTNVVKPPKIPNNINIGIAMAVEGGLLVPVINNSQDKNELEISKEIREFSKKIKNKQLLPHEISGSTFSITNLTSYNV